MRAAAPSTPLAVALAALAAVALLLPAPSRGGRGGSLDALADALVARARPALEPLGAVDVAVAVRAPVAALGADLAALLVTRLRAAGARSAARGDGDVTALRAAGFERALAVDLEVAGGELRARGAVTALGSSLWGREPELRSHLYAEAPLDAELRAYLPPVSAPPAPPERWRTRTLPLGDVDLLALDVGDLDGDGRAELAGATAGELVVWSVVDGQLAVRRRLPLGGRPAAVRPRADVATVRIEAGAVEAHASPFDGAVRLAGLREAARAGGRGYSFPGLGGACELGAGVDWFMGSSCAQRGLPERLWAAAGLRGGGRIVVASVDAAGTLVVDLGGGASLTGRGAGAQVALGALARGDVVAVSAPVLAGEPDAVSVRALTPGLPLVYRVERLPGNVRALAAGDLDGDGRAELVAAVRDAAARRTELWLID